MGVGDAATTTLALVVHELAANSLKYDALSVEAGMLDVSCDTPTGGMVVIWTERDGSPVTEPVGSRGYGSTLVSRATSGQLGGSIGYHWDTAGLIVSLRMNKDALAA